MSDAIKQVVVGVAKALVKQGKSGESVQGVVNLWQKSDPPLHTIDYFGMLLTNSGVTSWSTFRKTVAKVRGDKGMPELPGYDVLELVSAGPTGVVYRGRPKDERKYVAIKIIEKTAQTDGVYIRRFVKAGQNAAGFEHANIAKPIDAGETDSHLFYVMQFVEGSTVSEHLREVGPYKPDKAVNIIKQIGKGLRAAEREKLHHFGIKPPEILVTMKGEAKLAEIGMARHEGEYPYGSPYCMSPEQIRGKTLDHRSDLFSLGITFYWMVTGKQPFTGVRPPSVMDRILKKKGYKPAHRARKEVPKRIADVIDLMISRDPTRRYQSWDDFLTDMSALDKGKVPMFANKGVDLNELSGLVEPEDERMMTLVVPSVEDEPDPVYKRPIFWIGAGTAMGLLVIFLVVFFLFF